MNTQRLTAQSKSNIQAADRAEMVDFQEVEGPSFTVKIWKEGRSTYIHGSESVMLYWTEKDARRAVKRIRPDLEITSFN
jgi:hypothetical protein